MYESCSCAQPAGFTRVHQLLTGPAVALLGHHCWRLLHLEASSKFSPSTRSGTSAGCNGAQQTSLSITVRQSDEKGGDEERRGGGGERK